ncbi:hypothetical protein VIGAN_03185500, partial [Vigna angularis var. angularis]
MRDFHVCHPKLGILQIWERLHSRQNRCFLRSTTAPPKIVIPVDVQPNSSHHQAILRNANPSLSAPFKLKT